MVRLLDDVFGSSCGLCVSVGETGGTVRVSAPDGAGSGAMANGFVMPLFACRDNSSGKGSGFAIFKKVNGGGVDSGTEAMDFNPRVEAFSSELLL